MSAQPQNSRSKDSLPTSPVPGGQMDHDAHGVSPIRAGQTTPKRQSRRISEGNLYPGSGSKSKRRKRSFRTPVQTLPLFPSSSGSGSDARKFASKSFTMVQHTTNLDQDTPRAHIEAFLANVNSVDTKGTSWSSEPSASAQKSALRRSSPRKQTPRGSFKVPAARSSRKSFPLISNTPGSNLTPRSNVWNLVNVGEEQTPVMRAAASVHPADSAGDDADMYSHGGQEVSMSPITKSSESELRDPSVKSGYKKGPSLRSFHLLPHERTEDAESESSHYPLSQSGQEVYLSPMSKLHQSEVLDTSESPTERGKKLTRRSFRIPFTADMDANMNKSQESPPGQEVLSPEKISQSSSRIEFSNDDMNDQESVPGTLSPDRSHRSKEDVTSSSLSHRKDRSTNDADASNSDSREQDIPADSSALRRGDRSSTDVNTSSRPKDGLSDAADAQNNEELDVPVDNSSPRQSSSSVLETNTISPHGKDKSMSVIYAASKSVGGQDVLADASVSQRDDTSAANTSPSYGKDKSSNMADTLSKSNRGQEILPETSKKSVYDLSDDSLEESFKTPTIKNLIKEKGLDSHNVSKSKDQSSRSLLTRSKNRSQTPSSTNLSSRSAKQNERDGFDLSIQDPRSSTPLKRSKSFLHSTKRQSTIAAYLSNAEGFGGENVSMSSLPDVSPIRPYKRSAPSNQDQVEDANAPEHFDGSEVRNNEQVLADRDDGEPEEEMPQDSDDENLGQYSPLKTPHVDMNVRREVSTAQKRPEGPRTVNQDVHDQAKNGVSQRSRAKRRKTMETTLPRRSVKFFAQRHSSFKLSKDALEEIENASESYWANTFKALEVFALHAGRKTVSDEDVVLLMKTQGMIASTGDLHDLIREYLPMELRSELIPVAKP